MSLRLDVTNHSDPLGTILTQLTEEDYTYTTVRVELNGTGSGQVKIPSSNAKVTSANFAYGNYVRVWDTDLGEYIAGWWMGEGDFVAASRQEESARILTFGGPGSLAYLSRAVWDKAPWIASTVYNGPRDDGMWHWFQDQYGDILKRALDEAQDPDRPTDPIPDLTYGFTSTNDTANDPWESFSDSDYRIPIGQNYLQSVANWMKLGLTILMRPGLVLEAYQEEYGTDRTSLTFAAGKVRFETGVNIATPSELHRAIHEATRLKREIVQGSDSRPAAMVTVTDAGSPIEREGHLMVGNTADPAILTDLGNADLALRAVKQDTALFAVVPGDDELNGFYQFGWPGGSGHAWLGDTVTLHSEGPNGVEFPDFNETAMRIAAITWVQRPGADIDIQIELGATYYSISQPSIPGLVAPGASGCTCPTPPSGPYDSADPAITDYLWTFEISRYDDTTGLYPGCSATGSAWHPGYAHAHVTTPRVGNRNQTPRPPISAGTYHFRARIAGNATYGDVHIDVYQFVGGVDTLVWSSPDVGLPSEEVSGDVTFGAGTTTWAFEIAHNACAIFEVELSHGGGGGSFAGDSPPPPADDQVGSIGTEVGCYALCNHKHGAQRASVTAIDDAGGYFEGSYVEDALQELAAGGMLSWKQAVRAATTTAGTLASSFENGDTIDGVVLATGDRILIKDQAAGAENGIYTVNATGAPTRAVDFDAAEEIPGSAVIVMEGTANADKVYICTTNGPITLGSTTLAFTALSAASALVVQEDDVNVDTAVSTIDFRTALNVTSSPSGEANVSVDLGTGATQAAAGDHSHAGASAKASATSDLTATTGTAADVTGATLSLEPGTYIVIGIFDVAVQSNADRLFEGILDVGGTDENDLAVLLGVGLDTDDRVLIPQVWRITVASTTTVKLQARHSGGTTGDFKVNAANTTLTAFEAGVGQVAPTGVPNLLDSEKASADTPDDEFPTSTLDGQWTVVDGSSGTVSLLASSGAGVYDLATRPGWLLMQVGTAVGDGVELRQDYTLPDGKCIVAYLMFATDQDAAAPANNEVWLGIGVNDNDGGPFAGTSGQTAHAVIDTNSDGWRIIGLAASTPVVVGANVGGSGLPARGAFLRVDRVGLEYHLFYSLDGFGWSYIGSVTMSTAANNLWLWVRCEATMGNRLVVGTPWFRQGTALAVDPWTL